MSPKIECAHTRLVEARAIAVTLDDAARRACAAHYAAFEGRYDVGCDPTRLTRAAVAKWDAAACAASAEDAKSAAEEALREVLKEEGVPYFDGVYAVPA